MSRNEDIDNAIWADPDFDALSTDAALLYLWSFTNPRCGMAGIYRVPERQLLEGKLSPDRLSAALKELSANRFCFYEQGVLWVRSRARHLRTKGRPMIRSIELDLAKIPADNPLLSMFLSEYEESWVSELIEGFKGGSRGVPKNGFKERKVRTPSGVPEGFQGYGKGKGKGKGSKRKGGSGGKGKPADPSVLPDGSDPRLAEAARRCLPVLQRVAEARGANPVTLLAVYRAVESFAAKPHVQVAGEVEHWTVHGFGRNKPAKDIVARFRHFLDGSPDQAVRNPPPAYVDA